MKTLLALVMCVGGLAHADIWRPYDGDGTTPVGKLSSQQGMACDGYNRSANLRWRNKGGDWRDANGDQQGTAPFAVVPIVRSTLPQTVEVDIPRELWPARGLILRRLQGVVRIAARESTTPPVMVMQLEDGSTLERAAYADVAMGWAQESIKSCLEWAGGSSPFVTLSHTMMIAFDMRPDVVSARLRLTIFSSDSATKINIFALDPPIRVTQVGSMFVPTEDPEFIYRESFEDHKWHTRMGTNIVPNAQWTGDYGAFPHPTSAGLAFADGTGQVRQHDGQGYMLDRGLGAVGTGLMVGYSDERLAHGAEWYSPDLYTLNGKQELESGYFNYWVKPGKEVHSLAKCEGGKMPGLSGPTSYCAGSSVAANGLCGWSGRNAYQVMCDQTNPAWGHMPMYMYAYHGLMDGYYGQQWALNEAGLLKLDQYHCVEQYLEVNTPGVADGVVRIWINGTLALEKTDAYWRGVRPEQGYGNWSRSKQIPPLPGAETIVDSFGREMWLDRRMSATGVVNPIYADTNMAIRKAYMAMHNGGVTPPGKNGVQFWYDEFTVSKKRAGCTPSVVVPPPPVEVCGNGLDDNGDGLVDEGCPPPPVEICEDGIDNNGDGRVDEDCPPPPVEVCDDGVDNNGDGRVDEDCPPPLVELCGDQIDNDEDGVIDEDCPAPPTELELVTQALQKALADLAVAQAAAVAAGVEAEQARGQTTAALELAARAAAQASDSAAQAEAAVKKAEALAGLLKRIADILKEVE